MGGHGNSLYLQLLHVPLVLHFEGRVPAGRRVATVVSTRDLPATILDLVELSDRAPFPGTSLVPTWMSSDSTRPAGSDAISELTQDSVPRTDDPLTRSQGISLVEADGRHAIHRNVKAARPELYDVFRDAEELHNLALDSAGGVAFGRQQERLRALLKRDQVTVPPR
jgi:arylsulfatase A-like enzyme